MLELRIKELMKEKGVKAPFQALRKLGITHALAQKYMQGKKKWILLTHIQAICLYLRCEPNDLFQWVPDDALQDTEHQPLQKIKPKKPFDLLAAAKNLTPDELRKKFEPEE
jgi:putative transcriptional regulator